MSVQNEATAGSKSLVLESPTAGGIYASLFEKINLNPVSELSAWMFGRMLRRCQMRQLMSD